MFRTVLPGYHRREATQCKHFKNNMEGRVEKMNDLPPSIAIKYRVDRNGMHPFPSRTPRVTDTLSETERAREFPARNPGYSNITAPIPLHDIYFR
jgi:hypothetical protein